MTSTSSIDPELSLYIDGLPTVIPCFGIIVYTRELLSQHADAVLNAYERFEKFCPRPLLHLYGT